MENWLRIDDVTIIDYIFGENSVLLLLLGKGKGKGKRGFVWRLVLITPLRHSGMARVLKGFHISWIKLAENVSYNYFTESVPGIV